MRAEQAKKAIAAHSASAVAGGEPVPAETERPRALASEAGDTAA